MKSTPYRSNKQTLRSTQPLIHHALVDKLRHYLSKQPTDIITNC